ncbi:MAG: glycosyltransferase family 61 protein [Candidatus Sedimenticola sp. (ex Thyasira tokunagai)]
MSTHLSYSFATYDVGQHWLIGPETYLIDRAVPGCEFIRLPNVRTLPGLLQLDISDKVTLCTSICMGRLASLRSFLKSRLFGRKILGEKYVIDLRMQAPENWAHAFTNHLPLSLLAKSLLEKEGISDFILIFPADISEKILQLFVLSGFRVIASDDAIEAKQIALSVSPWISVRGERHSIIARGLRSSELASVLDQYNGPRYKKIFFARRDTRRLQNESQISKYLDTLGYKKFYPEDYSLIEQIALLSYADNIVAVHGAGLGPLIIRGALNDQPFSLVEIFSPAHMTDVFRVMTCQLGGKWIGVRGRIWPSLVKYAYMDGIEKCSLNDFYLDLKSLKIALGNLECH